MSQPADYTPATDFSQEEADGVAGRSTVRTSALDAELAAIETTTDQIRANLAIIQRDDTKLNDLVVEMHTLSSSVRALIATAGTNPRGAWLTATSYAVKDVATQGTGTYLCVTAHTSGTFAVDLAAVKWLLIFDTAAYTATGVSFTPTGTIAATNVQNALAEVAGEALQKSSNLSDVASAATSRTNLGVPSNAEAVLQALIDAKGDIVVGTAADTAARKAVGSDGYALQAQSGATDGLQYMPVAPFTLENGYLDWSVAGNVLTVAIKTWAGADPSATDPVYIVFRNSGASTGSAVKRKITAATSIGINNTALLGTVSNVAFRLWCVAFDDGGTVRLGIINCLSSVAGAGAGRDITAIYPLKGWGIASSTQESDTADNSQTFYTDAAAVAAKAYATIGYATWETGLAVAGTWSGGPTRVQLFGPGVPLPGDVLQVQRNDTGAFATGTTTIPNDDTIPQNTEGDQYLSQAVTPISAANALKARGRLHLDNSNAGAIHMLAALFQDATANALKAIMVVSSATGFDVLLALDHFMLAATSSATTLKVRAGADAAGTTTVNGVAGARRLGGVMNSYLELTEVMG